MSCAKVRRYLDFSMKVIVVLAVAYNDTLEKGAIAMHCNFRSLDVTQVILGFNYGARNAPAYIFNNFSTSADP